MYFISILHSFALFSWTYSYTLCTGGHFEPVPFLTKKYYRTFLDKTKYGGILLYLLITMISWIWDYQQYVRCTYWIVVLWFYFFVSHNNEMVKLISSTACKLKLFALLYLLLTSFIHKSMECWTWCPEQLVSNNCWLCFVYCLLSFNKTIEWWF